MSLRVTKQLLGLVAFISMLVESISVSGELMLSGMCSASSMVSHPLSL